MMHDDTIMIAAHGSKRQKKQTSSCESTGTVMLGPVMLGPVMQGPVNELF